MISLMRPGTILFSTIFLVVSAISYPAALPAKSPDINFKLLYHAAQLANAAYEGKSEILGENRGKSTWVATPGHAGVQYFIIYNHVRKIQAIAVRGTASDANWDLDMDTRGVRDQKAGIMMHRGFRTAAEAIYKDLKHHLKPGYTTYLTGHSLGGAVAVILGIYLHDDRIKLGGVYTFGQPKFTNVAGVRAYWNLPLLRVVNQNDVVALLPNKTSHAGQQFAHLGPVINLLSGPYYVYGTEQQAVQFSQGSFRKLLTQISVPDHKMKWYLKSLREKLDGAKQVHFKDRNKYIVRHQGGASASTGDFKRKYNFNHHN